LLLHVVDDSESVGGVCWTRAERFQPIYQQTRRRTFNCFTH